MKQAVFFLVVATWFVSYLHAEVPEAVRLAEQNRIEVIERVSKSTVAVFGVEDSAGGVGLRS